jgi:hypothetical protein
MHRILYQWSRLPLRCFVLRIRNKNEIIINDWQSLSIDYIGWMSTTTRICVYERTCTIIFQTLCYMYPWPSREIDLKFHPITACTLGYMGSWILFNNERTFCISYLIKNKNKLCTLLSILKMQIMPTQAEYLIIFVEKYKLKNV